MNYVQRHEIEHVHQAAKELEAVRARLLTALKPVEDEDHRLAVHLLDMLSLQLYVISRREGCAEP